MNTLKSRNLLGMVCAMALAAVAGGFVLQQPPPQGDGQQPRTRQPGQNPPPQGGEQGRGPGGPGGQWSGEGAPPGQGGPGGGGPGGARGGRGPNIEGSMKQMKRAMTQLQAQVTDNSKKDENLRLINDLQRGCVMAKGLPLPPDRLEDAKDDASKAKLNDEFHANMRKALRLMLDIEDDLVAGHGDAAKSKLDEIQKMREDSHKAMGVEEEE